MKGRPEKDGERDPGHGPHERPGASMKGRPEKDGEQRPGAEGDGGGPEASMKGRPEKDGELIWPAQNASPRTPR